MRSTVDPDGTGRASTLPVRRAQASACTASIEIITSISSETIGA